MKKGQEQKKVVNHEDLDGYPEASLEKDLKSFLNFLRRIVLPAVVFVGVVVLIINVWSSSFWYSEALVKSEVISKENAATCMHVKCVKDFKFETNYFSPSTVTVTVVGRKKTFFINARIIEIDLVEDKSVSSQNSN